MSSLKQLGAVMFVEGVSELAGKDEEGACRIAQGISQMVATKQSPYGKAGEDLFNTPFEGWEELDFGFQGQGRSVR